MEEAYGRLLRPGQRKVSRFIQGVAARHRFREPLLWTTDPRAGPSAGPAGLRRPGLRL
ncbi:MAG: hypothetical protein V8S34_04245 [Lawsonibacter sp.]